VRCVATAAFGVEAVVKRELIALGHTIERSENGKLYFDCDVRALFEANLWLRSADRVYIVLAGREVKTFDDLYEWVNSLPLEHWLSPQGRYLVEARSKKSQLHSLRDLQSITKKALVDRLLEGHSVSALQEKGERYRLLVSLEADQAELWLDTSGEGLFKRGYREHALDAPMKETLAAALVQLSFYSPDRAFLDPFCGSGTIPIEAAMIARNIAPGLHRRFDLEKFPFVDADTIKKGRREALKAIDHNAPGPLLASDVSHAAIHAARANAEAAGVDADIQFTIQDVHDTLRIPPHAVIITNPPYGGRIEAARRAHEGLGRLLRKENHASFFILSALHGAEKILGRAHKTRVLYNGPIKARLYQYHGPPPGKGRMKKAGDR